MNNKKCISCNKGVLNKSPYINKNKNNKSKNTRDTANQPFNCSKFAFQVAVANSGASNLYQIDLAEGTSTDRGRLSTTLNGIGYNATDGYIYGWDVNNDTVSRLASDGTVTTLNRDPNLPSGAYNVGDVDPNGHLYLYQSNQPSVYVIDVNPASPNFEKLVDPANNFAPTTTPAPIDPPVDCSDWAFNQIDGNLYAVSTTNVMFQINPTTLQSTAFTTSGGISSPAYGGAFFDNRGNFYGLDNNSGSVVKYTISGTTATGEIFSQSVKSGTNDGARCPTSPVYFADIVSEKSVDKASAFVGDVITYTINLNNVGNSPATSVTIFDTLPNNTTFVANSCTLDGAPISGSPVPPNGIEIGALANKVSADFSFQVTVDTLPDPNPLQNSAYLKYTYDGDTITPVYEDYATTNVVETEVLQFGVSCSKSVDTDKADIGDPITYTINLENTGDVPIQSIVILDTLPSNTTFIPGSVSGGSGDPASGISIPDVAPSSTGAVSFQVSADSVGTISNSASVNYTLSPDPTAPPSSGSCTTNSIDTEIIQGGIDPSTGGLSKSADKTTINTLGDIITYTITVNNNGGVPVDNVIVKDPIPTDITFIDGSVTIDGTSNSSNPNTGINIGTISPGQTVNITFQVSVDKIPAVNPIENIASITYQYTVNPSLPPKDGSGDSNPVDISVGVGTLAIEKSVDKEYATIGDIINYSIAISSSGNINAENVTFTDVIPEGLEFVPDSFTVNGSPKSGSDPNNGVNLGTLNAGSTTTIKFAAKVISIPSANPLINSATINYTYTPDPSLPPVDASNTSNEVSTQINGAIINPDDGSFSKSVDKTLVKNLGEEITYTLIFTNTGNIPANNVVLIDTIPTGATFVNDSVTINGISKPGANPNPPSGIIIDSVDPNTTITVTFKITIDSIPSVNPIVNSATLNYSFIVDPNNPTPTNISVNSNTVETLFSMAKLDIVKSVDKAVTVVGATLTYTIQVKNVGNVDFTNSVFRDTVDPKVTFIPGSVTLNGVANPSADLSTGIPLGILKAGQTGTITFKTLVTG